MRLVFQPAAETDLNLIYCYASDLGGVSVGERVHAKLTAACERIADFPKLGRVRDDLNIWDLELRSIAEEPYMIFYAVGTDSVYILRLVHGSREIDYKMLLGAGDLPTGP